MSKNEIDMCHGPIAPKLLAFAIPVMLSGVLQLLFNAADNIVVGRFVGPTALAAVGSTGSLTQLLINLLIGLSVGTNVIVARYIGQNDPDMVSKSIHTAITVSLIFGVLLIGVGFFAAEPLLTLMGSPDTVLPQSALYMRIYFAGMPIIMLYNFGSAVLRAVGDTRRPLYYLIVAGVANVLMNLLFVIVFHMGVAGVALATVLSQVISAVLVTMNLMKRDNYMKLDLHKLRIHKKPMLEIVRVGLPAGLQGMVFSLSNVVVQSSINSFGDTVMAGNVAASNLEGFVYTCMNSFYQASISFTSQNYGAMQYKRIRKVRNWSLILVAVTGLGISSLMYAFGSQLLGLYSSDPKVIEVGLLRMSVFVYTYFTCGMMDTLVGSLRGTGRSFVPMLVSMGGACGTRLIWIFTIFQANHTLMMLYMVYPISWAVTALVHFICLCFVLKKLPNHDYTPEEAEKARREGTVPV